MTSDVRAPGPADMAAAPGDGRGDVGAAAAAARSLLWDLRFAGEYADREHLPRRAGMTAPGTGVDAAGNLVTWAYNPEDPDGEAVIEYRESAPL